MKKILAVILIILLLGVVYLKWNHFSKEENNNENSSVSENVYLKKGYTEQEVKKIESFSTEIQEYLEQEDYISNLSDYWNNKEFQTENLKKYIIFSKKLSLSMDDIIYIVNHGYDDQQDYDDKTVALMHSTYYIHENLDRYLNYNQVSTIEFSTIEKECEYIISRVNGNLDYEFYTHDMDVNFENKYLILVNKFYRLSSNYVPENMVTIDTQYGVGGKLEATVYAQFIKMYEAASKDGLKLYIRSPYRSYATQQSLYNRYVANDGKTAADTYSARPGYSEHQTGLAFDVTSPSTNFDTFENSKEFKWLQENAHLYGFILRYPKGKEFMTGYIYEPWHYRYVGEEAATKIHETGLTFEEYYAYYVR